MTNKIKHPYKDLRFFSFIKVSCVMLLLLSACSAKKNTEKIPDGIISFDSMIVILSDIHIAEAEIFAVGNPDASAKAKLASQYKFISEKNKVSISHFKNSFDYYSKNVSTMNDLYDKVIDELSRRHAENEKQ